MRYISKFFTPICLIVCCFFVGCGSKLPAMKSYKMDIQQGNVVTSKMLLQLRPGMTKSQVRFIMGTPLIVDSFHDKRWDYFYQLRQQGKVIEKRRVILDFDKDLLTTVRGDVVAATDKTAETPVDTSAKSITATKKPVEKPWFDVFKFWGNDEPVANVETPNANTSQDAKEPAVAAAAVASSAVAPAPVGAEAATAASATDIASEAPVETESILKRKVEPAGMDGVMLLPQEAVTPPASVSQNAESQSEALPPTTSNAETVAIESETTESLAVKDAPTVAIQPSIDAWLDAWRNKNLKEYTAAYADDFKPETGVSKKTWLAQRKQRMSGKRGEISLSLEDVSITQNGSLATVQFFQKYASKVYSDEVTKQLDLRFDEAKQRWLITREFVVANGKRPSTNKVLAPENSSEHLDGVIEKIGF
ncbi:MAG: hypothetical protein B7X95_09045 [Methylophilaceae bacterium 17-44-8]|nr:MAG: hypothetical protein B7X95_09045 [Methylophilaceae bacterium 17-44-8]